MQGLSIVKKKKSFPLQTHIVVTLRQKRLEGIIFSHFLLTELTNQVVGSLRNPVWDTSKTLLNQEPSTYWYIILRSRYLLLAFRYSSHGY